MTNLREPYIFLMELICRLYGEKDCSRFSEAWMPLAYTSSYLQEWLQLGSHHFQAVEHLHTTGSDTERRGDSSLLHGIILVGCHVCQKRLRRHEPKLAHRRAPSPCIFQRLMGEHVQKILLPHLR
jgi:hypothetical protein